MYFSSFLVLCYSVIINTSSITLNTFHGMVQAKEERDKQFINKMRKKLAKFKADPKRFTAASGFILPDCTDTTKYTIDQIAQTITRNGNNGYTNEYFAVLNKYIVLSQGKVGPNQYIVYNVTITNLGDGLIFFGACRAPTLSDVTTRKCKASDGLIFSGLSVIYFGEQCYHLDAFSENNYVLSVRTCLSEYVVKNINYMVNITYVPYNPANSQQCVSVEVSFDGVSWFTTKDYGINSSANTDKTSLPIQGIMLPCIWMFVDSTSVKITNFTP
jgi:hypothetical protein